MDKNSHTWNKVNQWSDELEILQQIISKTDLKATTKWGGLVYTISEKNVIGIAGFKDFFTIWFFKGVFLEDKEKVLVNANEDKTKSLRQWRFKSKQDINESLIINYLEEAIAIEKTGKKYESQKKEVPTDILFQQEIDNNPILKTAFENLNLTKKNEFLEYIQTAKKIETKIARIEKIKPMIFANIGLNDKYK